MASGDKLRQPAPSSPLTLELDLTVLKDITAGGDIAPDIGIKIGAKIRTTVRTSVKTKVRAHQQRMIYPKAFIPLRRARPLLLTNLL